MDPSYEILRRRPIETRGGPSDQAAGIPAIVVIEHHMDLVMNLCESITVLDFGQKICQGTPSEVQSDTKVCTAYLGQAEV